MNQSNTHKRHRFPPGIIQYAVWLQHQLNLSHRDFNLGRHLVSAENYRFFRLRAFASWEKATAL